MGKAITKKAGVNPNLWMWVALAALIVAGVGVTSLVSAFSGGAPKVVVEGDYIEAPLSVEAADVEGDVLLGGTTNFDILSVDSVSISGANSGTFTAPTSTVEDLVTGGNVLATSTSATSVTLEQADLAGNAQIHMTPNVASLTYTFPATSSLTTLLPNQGDRKSWVIRNATTTAGITLTLAAGSGIDFQSTTSTLALVPESDAVVDCYRQPDTDWTCNIDLHVDAD